MSALVQALTQGQESPPPGAAPETSSAADLVAPPPASAGQEEEGQRHVVVFIDDKVEGTAALLEGVSPTAHVRMIGANENGVQVIADTLAALGGNVAGVHIFAHGTAGHLSLGNVDLSDATANSDYAALLSGWGQSLTADADILVYGCSVASGESGQQFVNGLAWLTGADVAASTDATGAASRGGDWDLEYRTDGIEQAAALSAAAMAGYDGLMTSAPVVTSSQTAGTAIGILEAAQAAITQLSVADSDSATLSMTVSATNGTVTLASTTGLTGLTGNGSGSITFSGSIADINAALAGMLYQGTVGSGGTDDYTGNATITVQANDGTDTHSASVAVAITPVNDAPILTNNGATVAEGGAVTFSTAHFVSVDPDNEDVQIIYKLAALPTSGLLTLNGNPVVIGTVFDQTQIGLLVYTHNGSQVLTDTVDAFSVTIEDGAGAAIASTAISITVTPVNQAPAVTATTTVYEGETGHAVSISITDPDQAGGVAHTIEITSLPTLGTLKFNGAAVTIGQQISSADLALLTYDASPNEPSGPQTFGIKVIDDGGGTGTPAETTGTATITVLLNDDDPTLALNTGTVTDTAGTAAIDNTMLQVTDPDSGDGNLTYTVAALPAHGQVQILQGSWKYLSIGSVFTQADINAGNIRYQHTGGGNGTVDTFHFTVKDGGVRAWPTVREGGIYGDATTTTLSDLVFNVTIDVASTGNGGSGSVTALAANTAPGAFTTATLTLDESGSGTITTANLSISDVDSTPSQLVYRLMTLSPNGTVYRSGVALGLYDSFTQADIDNNVITYTHNGSENFTTANNYIQFTVSDGSSVSSTGTLTFDITPVNDPPTATVVSTPVVSEGGSVLIDNAVLTITDVDGSGDKSGTGFATGNSLTFTVTTLPTHGTLLLDADSNGSFETTVTTATVITKAQLDGGRLRYTHDGTENFADSFQIVVDDNQAQGNSASSNYTVNIKSAPLNDAPVYTNRVDMTLAEGGTGTIEGSVDVVLGTGFLLVYSDPDSTTVQRQYRIDTAVAYGTLKLNGKALGVGSVFTQKNLDDGLITYTHNGSEHHADGFTFTVRDGAGGSVTGAYAITITGVNDAPTLAVPGTQTFATATPLVFSTGTGNAITIGDPDYDDLTAVTDLIQITLDLQVGGSTYAGAALTLAAGSGVTITSGTDGSAKLTFTGTKAQVQAALNGLSLQVPTDEDRTLRLVVTHNDLNNGGPDPAGAAVGYNIVTKNIDINTSNSNDAPVLTAPATISATEDTTLSFTAGNTISISDADIFGGTISVQLTVSHGKLTLGTTTDVTFASGSNDSATFTLTGKLSAINAALATLSYKGNTDYNGSESLVIVVNDGGSTGVGGAQTDTKTVAITVDPVNDTPTLAAPGTVQVISDGNPKVFSTGNGNAISFDDAKDIPYGLSTTIYRLTLSGLNGAAGYGMLTLGATTGVTFISGTNGASSELVIEGTKADLNAALQGLSFMPDAINADMSVLLRVTLDDKANGGAGALTATQDITISVSGNNDAPVITKPAPQSVNEDAALVFSAGNGNRIVVTDADAFGAVMTVTLAVTNGTITLATGSGVTVTGGATGTSTVTFTGTQAQLQAAIDGLSYQGVLNFNGSETLTVTMNDGGSTGLGGAKTTVETIAITVNPVNDTPAATVPGAQTVAEDTPLVFSAANSNAIGFADVDDLGGTMSVVLSVSHGTLTLAAGSGVTVTAGADGTATLTISGTKTQINAAVAGLTYQGNLDYVGNDTLTLVLSDGGHTGIDPGLTGTGTDETDTRTVAITVTPINDLPTIAAPTATQIIADNDPKVFSTANGNAITFDDAKDIPYPLTTLIYRLTLSGLNGASPYGALTLGSTTGVTIVTGTNGTSSELVIEGTKADLTAALNGLSFRPDTTNADITATLRVTLNDNANGGAGALTATTDIAIAISGGNDAPAIVKPAAQTVNEDTNLVFSTANGNLITVSDVDAFASTMTVTLSVAHGTLTLAGGSGVTISSGANGSAAVGFTGTQAQLNAALLGLTYKGVLNYNGPETLSITINDDGNTGIGGAQQTTQTVAITVVPVNDAPLTTVPGAQVVNEDAALVFSNGSGNEILFADVDDLGGTMSLTLTVTNGTLTVAGGSGASATGDGTERVTLTGSKAQLNAAVSGLIYQGALNYNGSDVLTVTLSDAGNTGLGGALMSSKTVDIAISAVNDAPVATVPAAQTVNEDTPLVFSSGNGNGLSFADLDDNGGSMSVTLSVSNGTLRLGSGSGVSASGEGTATVTFTGTKGQINAAVSGLTYQGVLNYNGSDTLSVTVSDNGNTGGTARSATQSIGITVVPVNDTPIATVPGAQEADGITPLTFSGGNGNAITFADVDDNGGTLSLTLSVAHGTLTLAPGSGVAVTGGSDGSATIVISGSKAQLNAAVAGLAYRPDAGYAGADTLSLTLNDNGNTGIDPGLTGGGANEIDSKTVAITVGPVNDPPVIGSPGAPIDVTVGTPVAFTGANAITITDPDVAGGPMTVTLRVTGGLLGLVDGGLITGGANGSPTIVLTGTLAQINAALGGLTFTAVTGGQSEQLTILVNDNGNTGSGGPLSATASVALTVAAVPVVPVIPVVPVVPIVPTVPTETNTTTPVPAPPVVAPVAVVAPPTPVTLTNPGLSEATPGGASPTGNNNSSAPAPLVSSFTGGEQLGGAPLATTDFRTSFYTLPFNPVELSAALQDRVLGDQSVESFSIPASAFRHSDPSQQIQKEAKMPDGSPLPSFVRFNAQTGEFAVDTAAAKALGVKAVDVKVVGRDGQANEASAQFRILLTKEGAEEGGAAPTVPDAPPADAPAEAEPAAEGEAAPTAAPTAGTPAEPAVQSGDAAPRPEGDAVGKPSLAAQLQSAGRAQFEAERDALLDAIRTLAA